MITFNKMNNITFDINFKSKTKSRYLKSKNFKISGILWLENASTLHAVITAKKKRRRRRN